MYKFDPNKKELTSNEVAELLAYLLSYVMRPNKAGENVVVLDEAFYGKLPDHLKESFRKVE